KKVALRQAVALLVEALLSQYHIYFKARIHSSPSHPTIPGSVHFFLNLLRAARTPAYAPAKPVFDSVQRHRLPPPGPADVRAPAPLWENPSQSPSRGTLPSSPRR